MNQKLDKLEEEVSQLSDTYEKMLYGMRDLFDSLITTRMSMSNQFQFEKYQLKDLLSIYQFILTDDSIRKQTSHSYCSILRSMVRHYNASSISFLLNTESIINYVESLDNLNTRCVYITAISYIMKKFLFPNNIVKEYANYSVRVKSSRNSVRTLNIATETNFKYEDLLKKYHEKRDSLPEHLNLVAALYIERPPLRSEWARSVMITNDLGKYPNAIRLDGDKVEVKLTDFKNSRDHEEYRYEFPPGYMRDLVRQQIELRGQDNTFLEYKERTLQLRIKELIRFLLGVENVGVQELRRSYETYLQSSNEYMSSNIEEQNRMHGELLHTYNIAREYRRLKRE